MKQFLITGGTGMVGKSISKCELKNRDVHITILTRSDKQSDDPRFLMLIGQRRLDVPSSRYRCCY